MVLTLQQLCAISIQKGLDNGQIPNTDRYPPTIRKIILDMTLARADIRKLWIIDLLTSARFLDGIRSIDTQRGLDRRLHGNSAPLFVDEALDQKFLRRMLQTLSNVTVNGETLGTDIEDLKLIVYGYDDSKPYFLHRSNLREVLRLIAQCPRTETIEVRFLRRASSWTKSANDVSKAQAALADMVSLGPRLGSLHAVTHLSFIGGSIATTGKLDLIFDTWLNRSAFKNLTTMRLVSCYVQHRLWQQFLSRVRNSLEELEFKYVNTVDPNDGRHCGALPIPLPALRRLKIRGFRDRFSAENFLQCTNLEYANLEFQADHYDLYAPVLQKVKDKLKLEIKYILYIPESNNDEGISKSIRWLENFGRNLISVRLIMPLASDRQNVDIVRRLADHCPNLVSIYAGDNVLLDAVQYFAQIFHDFDRASNFRKLQLCGNVDPGCFMTIFENCTNLEKLCIDDCSTLRDHQLIEWARRGGGSKLHKIQLHECENISDSGLIPIIVNAGERLVSFYFYCANSSRITTRTWRVLFDRCPFLKYARILPEEVKPLARDKCVLNKFGWMCDMPPSL